MYIIDLHQAEKIPISRQMNVLLMLFASLREIASPMIKVVVGDDAVSPALPFSIDAVFVNFATQRLRTPKWRGRSGFTARRILDAPAR
jgi:hypothetical protein